MAIKKSDLYSKIWKSCDELRGSMDASQYKDYILVILFMKYVTDKYYERSKGTERGKRMDYAEEAYNVKNGFFFLALLLLLLLMIFLKY